MKPKIFLILAMILFVISCSQTEDLRQDLPVINNGTRGIEVSDSNFLVSSIVSTVEDRQAIAEWFAKNYSLAEAKRIHSGIKRSIFYGLDEVIYLNEYVSTSVSDNKISNEEASDKSKQFASFYNNQLYTRTATSPSETSSIHSIYRNDNLQLYWPYSEDWDGVTPPVITYAPENINDLTSIGYTAGGGTRKVLVNEEYCMTHPVWIIKDSHIPYSDLPNFNKGERLSASGVYYCSTYPSTNSRINETASNEDVFVWQAQSIQVKKQYDGIFAGGSEIEFQISYPTLSGYAGGPTKQQISVKRKDIKKKKWINLTDFYFNTNWRPEQITNYLLITESDGGKNVNIPISLSYKNENGLTASVSTTLNIKSHDERICQMPIDRNFMLTHETMSFDNGNVSITMPLKKE